MPLSIGHVPQLERVRLIGVETRQIAAREKRRNRTGVLTAANHPADGKRRRCVKVGRRLRARGGQMWKYKNSGREQNQGG